MKKNSPPYDDEVDLIALIKIIWDGKIKILLITLISFLVGLGYNLKLPNDYLNSLSINPLNNIKFLKLDNIQKLLNFNYSNQLNQSNQSNQSNKSNKLYLDMFINELADYEEFLASIKNTKKIQENFSKLNNEEQQIKLFQYAKLLKIDPPKKYEEKYIINLKWHDPEEAKKILRDTLKLTSNNLKIETNKQLDDISEFEKKLVLKNDEKRLGYLKEQSAIAKELDIKDNRIGNLNLTQPSLSFNVNTADVAYYLRGFKAIDKEIELIQKRDYLEVKIIEQEINSFKKENFEWADYNVYLMEVKSLKDTKLILAISILFGLIVGLFYVLISNAFNQKKYLK